MTIGQVLLRILFWPFYLLKLCMLPFEMYDMSKKKAIFDHVAWIVNHSNSYFWSLLFNGATTLYITPNGDEYNSFCQILDDFRAEYQRLCFSDTLSDKKKFVKASDEQYFVMMLSSFLGENLDVWKYKTQIFALRKMATGEVGYELTEFGVVYYKLYCVTLQRLKKFDKDNTYNVEYNLQMALEQLASRGII